jgi:hypothetical protein
LHDSKFTGASFDTSGDKIKHFFSADIAGDA